MEYLLIINRYMPYIYLGCGLLALALLIILSRHYFKFQDHLRENTADLSSHMQKLDEHINESHNANKKNLKRIKKLAAALLFIHLWKEAYRQSTKKSLLGSAFKAGGARLLFNTFKIN